MIDKSLNISIVPIGVRGMMPKETTQAAKPKVEDVCNVWKLKIILSW